MHQNFGRLFYFILLLFPITQDIQFLAAHMASYCHIIFFFRNVEKFKYSTKVLEFVTNLFLQDKAIIFITVTWIPQKLHTACILSKRNKFSLLKFTFWNIQHNYFCNLCMRSLNNLQRSLCSVLFCLINRMQCCWMQCNYDKVEFANLSPN